MSWDSWEDGCLTEGGQATPAVSVLGKLKLEDCGRSMVMLCTEGVALPLHLMEQSRVLGFAHCEGREELGYFYHYCCLGHRGLISKFAMSGLLADAGYCLANICVTAGFLSNGKVVLICLSVNVFDFCFSAFLSTPC